jgi:branched-chain amino acid aminotransferase
MLPIIDINGKTTLLSEASIHPLDRGFLYGESIFETLAAFSGNVLLAEEHITRLKYSAKLLNFSLPWSQEELILDIKRFAEKNPYPKSYLRLVVTGGVGLGLQQEKNQDLNKITYIIPHHGQEKKSISLQLQTLPFTKRIAHPKTSCYLPSILALNEAKQSGYDDVLWLNSHHEITEASTANIFFIEEKLGKITVLTPSLTSGIVAGTMRNKVIQLLQENKIMALETTLYENTLPMISAAFTTSSIKGLVPIRRIGPYQLASQSKKSFQKINEIFLCWFHKQLKKKTCWHTGEPLL